jgi:subtilisin family serine protease
MNSMLRAWRWVHGKKAPSRPRPNTAQLSIEALEDRVVLSTSSTAAYQAWAAHKFTINDATLGGAVKATSAATASAPGNASFGSMIGLPSVFSTTSYRGQGYSVAVIDTGIDYLDPDLGGGFGPGYKVIAGWNFVNNTANPMDDNGHGTAVAGEIASSDSTYSGVAPDANLIALKVLDSTGSGTYGNVLAALDWVVANRSTYNIVAVNMSLGSGNYTINPYTFLDSDLSSLTSNGVFIGVAAGNSFYDNNSALGLAYPAIDPYVVSVGAVYNGSYGSVTWIDGAKDYNTAPDHIASFSQRGAGLDILAPGAMITSNYLNNTFESMAGTSMATPVVTGAAVLIRQALDAAHKTANESTILSVMQTTGVTDVDNLNADDNVVNTGLSFKRINLGAAIASIGQPVQPPTLGAIANQTVAPGGGLNLTLNGVDPAGLPLTYSASVVGNTASQAYLLDQQLGLNYMGSYYTNEWGQNEKWMSSAGGAWYCILPNGQVRRWAGSMSATLQPANLVGTLDASYYANPSLLWNATPVATLGLSVSGNRLTISAPTSATGNYQVTATVSNGSLSASQTFTVSIAAPLQIAPIANQTMTTGGSLSLTLSGNTSGITYSASVIGTTASQAYQLQQQLQLHYMGTYYTNIWGQNEKWMSSASGTWYCILPNGQVRRWAGTMAATMQTANLVATLSASYYTDPSLLWNAQAVSAVTVSVSGNQLTIHAPAGVTGTFQIQVVATVGGQSVTESFTVTVTG